MPFTDKDGHLTKAKRICEHKLESSLIKSLSKQIVQNPGFYYEPLRCLLRMRRLLEGLRYVENSAK